MWLLSLLRFFLRCIWLGLQVGLLLTVGCFLLFWSTCFQLFWTAYCFTFKGKGLSIKPSEVQFTALNGGSCLCELFAYLPSSQLFAIYTSRDLKNQQVCYCALGTLVMNRSPFSVKQTCSTETASKTTRSVWLMDRENNRVAQIKRPELFRQSHLVCLVQDVELPLYLTEGVGGMQITRFWTRLVSHLPETTSISICLRTFPPHNATPANDLMLLHDDIDTFRLILLRVCSFSIPAEMSFKAQPLLALLDEMKQLASLSLPAPLLISIAEAFGASRVAHRLTTISVHRPAGGGFDFCCGKLLESVALAGCLQLKELRLSCEGYHHHGVATGALASLTKLPQLRRLSLHAGCQLPTEGSSGNGVSLKELQLVFGRYVNRSGNLAYLLSQFPRLRKLHISLADGFGSARLAECMRSILSVAPLRAELSEFTIDIAQCSRNRSLLFLPYGAYTMLLYGLALCQKLQHLNLSGIVFRLSGYPAEHANINACGYWHLGSIVKALEANLTLKSVEMHAIVDSSTAVKSQLPANCFIAKLWEKPKASLSNRYVLHPDIYWQPVEILIVCERRKNDAAANLNSFADKLFLCIVNPSHYNAAC